MSDVLKNLENHPHKIALCFLVIATIDHEDIWADWLKPFVEQKLFSIYIHSKNKFQPSTSLFQEHSKQVKTFPTCWGCFSLVQATNQLIREAMVDDPLNYKFVLLSNSCIPVKPFLKVYQFLTRDNLTHISYFSKSMLEVRFSYLAHLVPKSSIKKHSQWVILNRQHAELCLDKEDEYKNWYTTPVFWSFPDESCYGTTIELYDASRNVQVANHCSTILSSTTFVNWIDNCDWPLGWKSSYSLRNYKVIFMDELQIIFNGIYPDKPKSIEDWSRHEHRSPKFTINGDTPLFARKFLKGCIVLGDNRQEWTLKEAMTKIGLFK